MNKLNYNMFPPSWEGRSKGCQPNYGSPHPSGDNRLWHILWPCCHFISTVIGLPGSQCRTALEGEIAWKLPSPVSNLSASLRTTSPESFWQPSHHTPQPSPSSCINSRQHQDGFPAAPWRPTPKMLRRNADAGRFILNTPSELGSQDSFALPSNPIWYSEPLDNTLY